ncbi:MAG: penicillin-binding protein 2 [Planctomycetota bacterium]
MNDAPFPDLEPLNPAPALPKNPQSREADRAQRVLIAGRIAVGAMTIALLALLGRTAQLQQRPDPRVTALLERQSSDHELKARRGMLLDRRGRPLANTRVAYRLFVDPALLADPATLSLHVSQRLGLDPIDIEKAMAGRPNSRYVVLDPRVDDVKIDDARRLVADVRGLALEPHLVRDYPQGDLAAQLVGFVNRDGRGIEGLEKAFDQKLAGNHGGYALLRDARRRPLWIDAYEAPPKDGQALRLTIDLTLQRLAEEQLDLTLAKFNAKAGQMVVLDPHSGEILALANANFNPQHPDNERGFMPRIAPDQAGNADPEIRRNRAVTDVFEPGSIFKPLVWAAATEQGFADPTELIDCSEQGWWKPERGPVLRDATPHGTLSWENVLVQSSNIGMGVVAERMGKEHLHAVVASFGFGATTNSGLIGEQPGLLRDAPDWSWTDLTRVPMGHGVAVTPLQVTRAFAALANDGTLRQPTVLLNGAPQSPQTSLVSPDVGSPTHLPPARVMSPETAVMTRRVLRRVMTDGTGRRANSKQYAMFGKSGTAQLPDPVNGGYLEGGYVSSFVAGAPLDRPRLVVGCFIHEPDRSIGHYGGTVAGPAVRDFLDQALAYLGEPTIDEADNQIAAR